MSRNTLARAYAAKTAQPGLAPAGTQVAQPAPAAAPVARTLPAGRVPQREMYIEDALLIAVRRSLASCRDSSQLRMLSAFEARR
jgi:hypothetical protein